MALAARRLRDLDFDFLQVLVWVDAGAEEDLDAVGVEEEAASVLVGEEAALVLVTAGEEEAGCLMVEVAVAEGVELEAEEGPAGLVFPETNAATAGPGN